VVAVTVKTFDILVALIEDAGRVVEKHELAVYSKTHCGPGRSRHGSHAE